MRYMIMHNRHFSGGSSDDADISVMPVYALWASSPDDVWAAGATMHHRDASGWQDRTIGSGSGLNAIVGVPGGEMMAMGDAATVFERDGTRWVVAEQLGDNALFMFGLWASGVDDVWMVGVNGETAHRIASGWAFVESNVTEDLSGVWGSASNDVWAVGEGGRIIHWGGEAWAPAESPTTTQLNAIWGAASDDAWAVGRAGAIVHWNGAQWQLTSSGIANDLHNDLHAVWGRAANDVWAVGCQPVRWDGLSWTRVVRPTTVCATGVAPGAGDDVWIAGLNGRAARRDGAQWIPSTTGCSRPPQGLWVTATVTSGPLGRMAQSCGTRSDSRRRRAWATRRDCRDCASARAITRARSPRCLGTRLKPFPVERAAFAPDVAQRQPRRPLDPHVVEWRARQRPVVARRRQGRTVIARNKVDGRQA